MVSVVLSAERCRNSSTGFPFFGFYVNTYGLSDAATIDDLAAKIASGDIRFCSPMIKVQACNTGSGTTANFAKRLSETTDGTTYGATGLSSPEISGGVETGWFWSSGSAWKKWGDGTEVANPHTTDADLSTPNLYGSNKLRCW